MQVILMERVPNLGFMGDVVMVRPGYARNFLLPQKKALRASKSNIAFFEKKKSELHANDIKRKAEAEKAAKRIEGQVVTLIRQASDAGHLYGSVRPKDISEGLAIQGIIIERTQVHIQTGIKLLGIHAIEIILHPEVKVSIRVNVAKTEEEAAVQLNGGKPIVSEDEAEEEAVA